MILSGSIEHFVALNNPFFYSVIINIIVLTYDF